MKFEAKEITLKNGKKAILRNPRVEDAAGMLEYFRAVCEQTEFVMRYPEECNQTLEQEQGWIVRNVESENILMICCEADGKIVGNCEIHFQTAIKTRHCATIAIANLSDYWNLGIGTAMFTEMIAAAEKHGTLIIDLEFTEGNDRGRHLYEKMGFRVVSEKPNAIRLKDGTFRNLCYMQKILKEIS